MVINVQKDTIMKKTYISPDMIVANLPTRRVLLTSYLGKGANMSSGSADAREFELDDEDF